MDELYELVEKDLVSKLEKENLDLKIQVEKQFKELQKTNISNNSKLIEEIIIAISNENQKERNIIGVSLNEIKELNKNTLDNVILKTQNLEIQFEEMVKLLQSFSGLVSELIEELREKNLSSEITEVKLLLTQNVKNTNSEDIKLKLENIDKFMNNLKIFLAQIRPSDLKLESNNNSNNNNVNSVNTQK